MNYSDAEILMDLCDMYPNFTDATEEFTMPKPAELVKWLTEHGITPHDLNHPDDIPEPLPEHTAFYYYDDRDWPGTVVFTHPDDAVMFRLRF